MSCSNANLISKDQPHFCLVISVLEYLADNLKHGSDTCTQLYQQQHFILIIFIKKLAICSI